MVNWLGVVDGPAVVDSLVVIVVVDALEGPLVVVGISLDEAVSLEAVVLIPLEVTVAMMDKLEVVLVTTKSLELVVVLAVVCVNGLVGSAVDGAILALEVVTGAAKGLD